MKWFLFHSSLVVLTCLSFGVDAAVTYYDDRDEFLAALGDANIIESTATRRKGAGGFAANIRLPYSQCDLKFNPDPDRGTVQHMQMRFGQHTGSPSPWGQDNVVSGNAVYFFYAGNLAHYGGYRIDTTDEFYAIGFDHAKANGGKAAIKVFDGEVREFATPPARPNSARFSGWISDGEPVSSFTIGSAPSSYTCSDTNTGVFCDKTAVMFTNVIYATPNENAMTSVGCYVKDAAQKSCAATSWGDPHLVTYDGMRFDVQAHGEVIMTKSMDSPFEIQARLEGLGRTTGPSVVTGIVVKDEGLPTVQVNVAKTPSATTQTVGPCPLDLYVDGTAMDITAGTGTGDARVKIAPGKVVIEYPSTNVRVDMRYHQYRDTCLFSVDYLLADCRKSEDLIGLLGSPDDIWQNDWMTRDGEVLELPDGHSKFFFKPAYDYAVDNWCIRDVANSAFTYEDGMDFWDFANCGNAYDPTFENQVLDPPAELEAVCNGDIGCLVDGVELGTEAANDYLDEKALEKPLVGPDPTASPTVGPTSGPTNGLGVVSNNGQAEETSGSLGDPHFKTWKNEHYEYHGQCDMILVKDDDFADGLGLNIQIRTKLVRFWSYIKQVAIRIGDDILEVEGSADPEVGVTNYWINLEPKGDLMTLGGFPIEMRAPSKAKRAFIIDLDQVYPGHRIEIRTFKEFVRVDFFGRTAEAYGNTVGMLGDFETGETRARDGSTVLHDFSALGNEWQVLPFEDMLFHDTSQPQFPKKCVEPEDPRGSRRRRLDESSVKEEEAEAACAVLKDPADRKDCVYDILATQDLEMVGAY